MLRHTVLLNWKSHASEQSISHVTTELEKLPALIPQILALHFGADEGIFNGSADYVLVADFEDEQSFRDYVVHQAHQDFMKDSVGPILESYQAAQFVVN